MLTGAGSTKFRHITAALGATIAVVLGAAVAGTAGAAGNRAGGGSLSGAGSSFVFPLVSQWAAQYKTSEIKYSPIGSGGGIAAITNRTVDFGASDAPLSPDQFSAAKGVVQIPWALSATSIAYNLPGGPARLKINGRVLAAIYLGKIKQWNDPQIKRLNKGASLPGTKITPVYRSDNSGTSFNFTDYLSTASPDWKSKYGRGVNVNWPAGEGGRGSAGVAGIVSRTQGALTYVDVAYALKNHLQIMAVQNRFGKYAAPGIRGIKAAGDTIKRVPADNALSIVNPPKSKGRNARLAYPICTFTYVIVPLKTSKAAELRSFVFWALTKGQAAGPRLLFVPVPKPVLVAAEKTLKRVHS